MAKKVGGLKFNDAISDEKIAEIMNKNGDKETEEFLQVTGKIRISTMLDADILSELKRRSQIEGDGRYQTYLNHFLRTALFEAESDEEKIVEVVKSLVKPSALKRKRA